MCTTLMFKIGSGITVAHNLDSQFLTTGLFFTNQRGISKTAMIFPPDTPAVWTSKYGSITYNHVSKEFPCGGLNEAGLVVEQMTLPETEYPVFDEHPAIKDLQWIQYMLDTCASVTEVINTAPNLRIAQSNTPLHYMFCDKNGAAAVIEYLKGRLVCYTGEQLPFAVLSNSSYRDSLAYYSGTLLNTANNPYIQNSLKRFKQSVALVESAAAEADLSFERAFEILDSVKREDTTWQIVYDLKEMWIYWRKQPDWKIQVIDFKKFDFENNLPSKVIDPDPVDHNPEIMIFNYSRQLNRELAEKFFRNETLSQILNLKVTEEMLDYFAEYPEQMKKL